MLGKCIDEDKANWFVELRYVLMAYRPSVHESTGLTPPYLIFGHEISLPLDLMYRPPPSTTAIDVHDSVSQKEEAFRQAYELVRLNATTQQRRRNILYNKRVHGPKYKENELGSSSLPHCSTWKKSKSFQSLARPLRSFEMFKHR